MRVPTTARWPTTNEWSIITAVFGDTMPFRQRILITDGLGGGDRPFTIPTAAISLATIPAAMQAALAALVTNATGRLGDALTTVVNFTGWHGIGAAPSQLLGIANLGYLVNVGPTAYPNMDTAAHRNLLVHEFAHVWQGKNSTSSTTYVANSMFNQCRADFSSGSHGGAYAYTAGNNWRTYNAEQQASIVEDWYAGGMAQSGALWPYVRDYVRKGIA